MPRLNGIVETSLFVKDLGGLGFRVSLGLMMSKDARFSTLLRSLDAVCGGAVKGTPLPSSSTTNVERRRRRPKATDSVDRESRRGWRLRARSGPTLPPSAFPGRAARRRRARSPPPCRCSGIPLSFGHCRKVEDAPFSWRVLLTIRKAASKILLVEPLVHQHKGSW